jgi:hypothetical protein
MMGHTCNPFLGRRRQEDHEFQTTLGYRERLSQKTKQNKKTLKKT